MRKGDINDNCDATRLPRETVISSGTRRSRWAANFAAALLLSGLRSTLYEGSDKFGSFCDAQILTFRCMMINGDAIDISRSIIC